MTDQHDLPTAEEVDGDPLATINQRIGARVIDWLILGVAVQVVVLTSVGADIDTDPPTWVILTSIGVVFFYETLLVAWRGKTIGKMIIGIEIVHLADGRRPSLLNAALRVVPIVVLLALLGQLSYIAMVFVYFTAAFMRHYRGVLDRLAGTVVIQSRGRQGLLG